MATADRLSSTLQRLVGDVAAFAAEVGIGTRVDDSGPVVFVAPKHHWLKPSPEQKRTQLDLSRRYGAAMELLAVLTRGGPPSLLRELEEARTALASWIELEDNWSLSSDRSTNAAKIEQCGRDLQAIVGVLAAGPRGRLVVVADTNSMLECADPVGYRGLAGAPAFDFLLLPTVLSELDKLKIEHRNPDVRDKAKKVITRIKGWRHQGPLLEGVTIDKSIVVRARHNEPKVSSSLSWLDPDNADDRIIASVLDIQAEAPSARVLLVTGDINLQNKADAAMIETVEF